MYHAGAIALCQAAMGCWQ